MSGVAIAEWTAALSKLKESLRYDPPEQWIHAYRILEPYRRRYIRYLGTLMMAGGALVLLAMLVIKLEGGIAMMSVWIPLAIVQWASFKFVPYLRRVQQSALTVFYFDEVVAALPSEGKTQ